MLKSTVCIYALHVRILKSEIHFVHFVMGVFSQSSALISFFFFNIYLFMYLAVPGLSCSTRDL